MQYDDKLIHYGVKGMKWGVRRYQNKDGSYTDVGKKRQQNLRKISKHGYDLPKGAILFRAERNGTKDFMKRGYTYVSATDKLYEHAMETNEGFNFDGDGEFDRDFKLKTTRPLKIASTEDYFNAVMKSNGIDPNQYLSQVPSSIIKKGKYVIENKHMLDHKFKEGAGGNYTAFNNAITYLKKQGYDGVVDPLDGATQERYNGAPIATVVFDPEKNVEIIYESKRW